MEYWALFFLSVISFTAVSADRGFLFTVPRVLSQGADNDLHLSLYDVDAPGEITITLKKPDNDTVLSQKTSKVEAGTQKMVIPFPVPETDDYEAKIQIRGEFETTDVYNFVGEDKVGFKLSTAKIIFIQTDKPIYKTGQQVKFRVLPVDLKLKPIGKDAIGDIWVEDPSGSRIAQWKNVSYEHGIEQFDFPLSQEPNLGTWKIFAEIGKSTESTNFEVKEYVLPKYEVIIKPPTFVLADAEIIPIEICARYTYGKPVNGQIKINTTLETYSWANDKFPALEIEEELNGCYKYNLNISVIDAEFQYSYRRIQIFTEITEKGTDIVKNETKYVERTQSPLNINFQTEARQYFKPGLPYKGTVKVTHPDDTAAADEPVQVCSTVSRERILSNWWATKKLKHCRNLTSDDNGIVTFTVPPQSTDSVSLTIEAKSLKYLGKRADTKRPHIYQPQTSTYLRPWFSQSGSHLQVQAIGDALDCGTNQDITVYFTAKDSGNHQFFYEIISGGQVIEKNFINHTFNKEDALKSEYDDLLDAVEIQLVPSPQKNDAGDDNEEFSDAAEDEEENQCKAIKEAKYVPFVGSVQIPVKVTAAVSSSFHLLVYYIRDDRETIADSQQFQVEKCFENEVNLVFGDDVKQPGTKTSLTLSASPKSLCGIRLVDKSISLLDNSNQLDRENVFRALDRLNYGRFYPRNHCNDRGPAPGLRKRVSGASQIPERPPRPGWWSSSFEDAVTAFENTGYLVISDLVLLTRPCKSSSSNYENYGIATAMPLAGVRGSGNVANVAASRRPVAAPAAFADSAGSEKMHSESTKSVVDVRTFFPETWLFDVVEIGDDGKLVQKETLPHTITEWLGSAVCINDANGLGISNVTSIKGFQAFFVSFTLPYSVIRGEKVPVIVTLFNYVDKCLPISLELERGDGFTLLSESEKTELCVCGGKTGTHRFYVQPTTVGTLNFTVHASTAKDSQVCSDFEVSDAVAKDAVTNPLIVEAEGFLNTEVSNHLFCPKDSENGIFKRDFKYSIPEDVVEGSSRGYLSITGDIMGPSIQGLDRLVQLPTGCGEQNIVLFAPNVYVLDYLKATGKLTDKLKNKALNNLRTGYQRELKYRHSDGSYSAFGKADREGSMFLTAFVLRSFSQASKYIDIDPGSLNQTTQWIVSKQNENGCFPEVGRTLSYSIKGGIKNSNTSSSMTAYVLASLITAGVKSPKVISEAITCISNDKDISAYQAALFAFTSALAESKDKPNAYLEDLFSRANNSAGVTYFPDKDNNTAVEVETAAYAILALLELDEPLERSLPIIRWLTKNRNSNGGFIGTQDTVLGLESLSEFSSMVSQDPVDLSIKASGSLENDVQITGDDRILVKKYPVTQVPGDLSVEASGSGCGLIQTTLLYNTKEKPKLNYFNLEITALPSDGCKQSVITVCTRYLPQGLKSSMALIQVKMVSGMVPSKESLGRLQGDRDLELKRHEFENNEVTFYFDELTNKEKCFEFNVEQVIDVEDRKPATAKVFDYYAKDHVAESTYTIPDCKSLESNP